MSFKVLRPLIWLVFAYSIGISSIKLLNINPLLLLLLGIIIIILAWFFWRNPSVSIILLLITATLIGYIYAHRVYSIGDPLSAFHNKSLEFEGEIIEHVSTNTNRAVYVFRTNSFVYDNRVHYVNATIRLNIYLRDEDSFTSFNVGNMVSILGELELPKGVRNPGGFDYKSFLARQGIQYILNVSPRNAELTGNVPLTLAKSLIENTRHRIRQLFSEAVGGLEGNLITAMLLGDVWLLPEDIKSDFRITGLSHILAISGLHIGFIVIMLNYIFRVVPIPILWANIFKILILWFYCALTGATPSVLRAVLMATFYLGAKLVMRKADPLNTLASAALSILIISPLDLFSIGFQLSFSALLGILLLGKKIEMAFWFLPNWLKQTIVVTLAAQLGVSPILAFHFNMISLVSVLTNLVFVPFTGLMVMYGFIVMILGLIFPIVATVAAWPLNLSSWVFVEGASLAANLPMSHILVVSPSIFFITSYYLILLLVSEERPEHIKRPIVFIAVIASLYFIVAVTTPLAVNELKIVFLDVGQGDAIYIRTPDEKHILIDAGGRHNFAESTFDTGEDIVLPFLLKNGVSRLDMVVMSHDHIDHVGGLEAVLRDLPVRNFVWYPPTEKSDTLKRIKNIVSGKNIESLHAYEGQKIKIGNYVTFEVFYPDENKEDLSRFYDGDDNNRSLVMMLRHESARVLFTGDIYENVEKHIAKNIKYPVDILKVAHHGSITSSSEEFLSALNPELAIIQVGENKFGHPHKDVLDRLRDSNITVLRNDLHGAVICVYHNGSWKISWMND